MAASTDKFRKLTNNFSTTLTAAVLGPTDTSISLASAANLPLDTAIDLVIDRVDSNGNKTPALEEYVKGVLSGSTVSSLVRGLGNSTAQAHALGAVVEVVYAAQVQNDMVDGLLSSHNQDGSLKASAVTASALADNSISSTKYIDGSITTNKYADGSITAQKLSGVWWAELGRTTLSTSSSSISIPSFSGYKYLRVYVATQATGGTIRNNIRFNNDSAANYAFKATVLGGSTFNNPSVSSITLDVAAAQAEYLFTIDIVNIATQEKLVYSTSSEQSVAGAATVPVSVIGVSKWANTTNAITRIDILNIGGTGSFAAGSEVVVLGHN